MLVTVSGDVFESGAEAVVVTTNCVGAMGAGVAKGARDRWPALYAAYRADCGIGLACDGSRDAGVGPSRGMRCAPCCRPGTTCRVHRVRPGVVTVRPTGDPVTRWVLDLPTKRHWTESSDPGDVAAGLSALAAAIVGGGWSRVAMTPPGCGHGGLSWRTVGPMAEALLGPLAARVTVHGL